MKISERCKFYFWCYVALIFWCAVLLQGCVAGAVVGAAQAKHGANYVEYKNSTENPMSYYEYMHMVAPPNNCPDRGGCK